MKRPRWDQVKERIDSAEEGASQWVRLKDNGDKAVGVFLGDPHAREVHWTGERYAECTGKGGGPTGCTHCGGGKPSLRIVINLAVRTEQGWQVKALEQTPTFFKDVMKVDQKYGLDSWCFEIERHGAAGDTKTTYSILPEEKLGKEDRAALEKLTLLDLPALYTEREDEAQSGSTAGAAGGAESAKGNEPVPGEVAEALITVLKALPREYTDRFLKQFGIRRVRDLRLADKPAALELLDRMEAEHRGATAPAAAAEEDPFA